MELFEDFGANANNLHPLLISNPHDLVPFLELNLYFQESIPDLSSFRSPRLFASHMPYVSLPQSVKQSKCKIVYLCRNPKDMFISWWHFISKLLISLNVKEPWLIEDAFETFCGGRVPYGPYWDSIFEYYKQSLERPDKVLFLTFEKLKREPVSVLKELAAFVGHGFTKEEEDDNDDDDSIVT